MIQKKYTTEERRKYILSILKERHEPITGSELSIICSVSRQIIVGDITLLKARNEPIIATPSGYIYIHQIDPKLERKTRIIASLHTPEQAEEELMLLVDCGVTVKDVKVEHPMYGDLTASIMVSTRQDVRQFIANLKNTNASLLSQLTNGLHLHTIEAASEAELEQAVQALRNAGFLKE